MILCRTPYRISLFGGGTDYPEWFRSHGGACLAATIDHYCHVSVRWLPPFFPHRTRVVWSKIELVKDRSDIAHPAVRAALEMLDLDGVEIHHDGDLPARSGIGSSSAFAVGLLQALYGLRGLLRSPEQLAEDATHLEFDILEEPVGCQDQILCALGGFRLISFGRDGTWRADPVMLGPECQLEAHLLLVYTGPRQSAPSRMRSSNERALQRIQEMPQEAVGMLANGDLPDFADLLDEAWARKRELGPGITTIAVDDLYQAAKRAGARSGKLLGSGGGGFLLLFCDPAYQADVLSALRGCVPVPFRFEGRGSEIVHYRPEVHPV